MLFLKPAFCANSVNCNLCPTLGQKLMTLLPSLMCVLMLNSAGLCAESALLTRWLRWRRIKAKQDKEAGIAAQQAEKDAKKKKDKKK